MNKKILLYLAATVTWFMLTASTCVFGESFQSVDFEAKNNTRETFLWIHKIYPEELELVLEDYGHWRVIEPFESDCMVVDASTDDIRRYFSTIAYGYCVEIFISADTVKKYGWEDVVKNNRVYQQYHLRYEDAVRIQAYANRGYGPKSSEYSHLRFTVPPFNYMSEVEMWPPYGYYE